jgi:lipoprotein-anchoring transpeptidase ErfK/SrfK
MVAVLSLHTGCGNYESLRARPAFQEAALLSARGSREASLEKYQQIIMRYPSQEDRALFEMGIIHAHPESGPSDYGKSLECFERIVTSHPLSGYRQDSEMMAFYIDNAAKKDEVIAIQQGRIESLRRELGDRNDEVAALRDQVAGLEKKWFSVVLQYEAADKILIVKRERRLLLMSKGEVLKSYKVALGSVPSGPKERLGDNRTPEGTYHIDAKNRDSGYHLSLHISYPNASDKRRAKEMGVEPGGNIMIHGIKNGFSEAGVSHVGRDWTQGCIAVTDEEIEEIDRLTPIGTVVEITQ